MRLGFEKRFDKRFPPIKKDGKWVVVERPEALKNFIWEEREMVKKNLIKEILKLP